MESGDWDQPQISFSKVQANPAGTGGVDVCGDVVVEPEKSGF